MSKRCPVCDEVLPEVVPAYCERCGWDLKNDITFVLTLQEIPKRVIEEYEQRLMIATRNWQERIRLKEEVERRRVEEQQRQTLIERQKKLEEELKRLKEENERIARQGQREVDKQVKGGQTYICPVTGMEFVFVKGGKFMMGDIWGDGYAKERPVHEVELDDFYMGKYPVTHGQWKKVMGSNPSYFKNCGDNCPVESVSWYDAQEFIKKLNSMTDGKYRLPYEAEWEYAASWAGGGKKHKWAGTDDEDELENYAWSGDNSHGQTHPVGQKKPNALGLYDMSGNVLEWCMDRYDENYYKKSPKKNPTGPNSGDYRVMRGGSWHSVLPDELRVACRDYVAPDYRYSDLGLRLLRTP